MLEMAKLKLKLDRGVQPLKPQVQDLEDLDGTITGCRGGTGTGTGTGTRHKVGSLQSAGGRRYGFRREVEVPVPQQQPQQPHQPSTSQYFS
jgi:hypothetical protein